MVCKDQSLPCDICTNDTSSSMAQCNCSDGTVWDSNLKTCVSTVNACTSPAVWDNTSKTCKATVTTTYPAVTTYALNRSGSPAPAGWGGILSSYHVTVGTFNDKFYAATAGTYTISAQIDNYGTVYLDGTAIMSPNNWPSIYTYSKALTVGEHTLRTVSGNYDGPWGTAVTVKDPNGVVIWNIRTGQTTCNAGDGYPTANQTCVNTLIVTKPSNCTSPYTSVTSGGKCSKTTTCPLGNYTCTPTATSGGGTIENTDTTQGQNDKTANGTYDATGNCVGQIYIFNGKDMRCRPPGMQTGYSDCCTKTDAWLGLKQCDTNEQALGKARVASGTGDGYCHYIGDYCAEEWNLGLTKICVQKRNTYCCFNGLLARIIQEQGRPQLGIDWGGPESPNCRGFTPDEFQKLDFSKFNLTEFTDKALKDAQQNINKNVGPQINSEIQRFNDTLKQ